MIDITASLLDQFNITFENRSRIFVDGANPSFIRALKERVEEDPNYEQQITYFKHNYPSVYDLQILEQSMFVIPVAFKESITTIKISKTTHQKLVTRGKWGETLDDILARVLDELDDCDKAKGKK